MRDFLAALLATELAASPLRGGRSGFWLSSRMHRLQAWPQEVWIKRDDELSCTISGSKLRKLASLSTAWQRQEADCLVAWGSARSQHLLALLQLSREQGLELHLLTKAGSPARPHGPDQLWPLFGEISSHQIVPRTQWSELSERADTLAQNLRTAGHKPFLVKEGGAQQESLLGAMSLVWDIVQQEENLGWQFSHIFVDAGTGLTAQALVLGLTLLGRRPQCELVLCAGSPEQFARDLATRQLEFETAHGLKFPPLAPFRCHYPPSARSFGSTNATVFEEIARTAAESGVLLDPIYSAKLFLCARSIVPTFSAASRVLLIHSGGALSLFGFPLP